MFMYLIVDGMVSGTGVRDEYESVYIEPETAGLSVDLIERIKSWHTRYKEQFYNSYGNENVVKLLDIEGVEIAKAISNELENCKVSYFSDAKCIRN